MRLEINNYDLSSVILKKMNEVTGVPTSTLAGNAENARSLGTGKITCDSIPVAPYFGKQTVTIDLSSGQVIHASDKFVASSPSQLVEDGIYQISTLDVLLPYGNAVKNLGVNLVAVSVQGNPNEADNLQLIGIDAVSTAQGQAAPWKASVGTSSKSASGFGYSTIQMLCTSSP